MSEPEGGLSDGDASYRGERAVDLLGLTTMLNISEATAYTLANDPLFPSFRVGRQHRFWPSEVRRISRAGPPGCSPRSPWVARGSVVEAGPVHGRKGARRPRSRGHAWRVQVEGRLARDRSIVPVVPGRDSASLLAVGG